MDVDVILSPAELKLHDLKGKLAVVIDVFRFTTTVLTALEAGMEAFYPVEDLEEAWHLKRSEPGLLLAGERNALKIDGFDFGNSPLEHRNKDYSGGRLICSTTNGTRAIKGAQGASQVILASLRSAAAVAAYLEKQTKPIIFIPAGLEGKFSLEDTWCAGLIMNNLTTLSRIGDGAKTAIALQQELSLNTLKDSAHGQRLQELGLFDDLEFCLECSKSSGVINWDPKSGWGSLVR